MDGKIDEWKDGWTGRLTDIWTDGQVSGKMDRKTN
jgi:hypothetical protein